MASADAHDDFELCPAMIEWSSISFFGGKLNPNIIQLGSEEFPSIQSCISYAFSFLKDLFNNPTEYNIPGTSVRDIKELGETFWPDLLRHGHKSTRRISFETTREGRTEVRPVPVHFGAVGEPLYIADAASALGYIFSSATPPEGTSWCTYLYPLAILYSWFVHLMFVHDPRTLELVKERVPLMTCLMYDPKGWKSPNNCFFLSHTYKVSEKYEEKSGLFRKLDIWRGKSLLELQPYYIDPQLRAQDHPLFEQAFLKRSFGYICGNPPPAAARKEEWCEDFFKGWIPSPENDTIISLTQWLFRQARRFWPDSGRMTIVEYTRLFEHKVTGSQLKAHLRAIMRLSVRNKAARKQEWRGFMKVMFTPIINQNQQPAFALGVSPMWEAELDKVVSIALQDMRLNELEFRFSRAWKHVSNPEQDPHQEPRMRPFGRCAEQGPLKAVTAVRFPSLSPPESGMPKLQGIAISTRTLAEAVYKKHFEQCFDLELVRAYRSGRELVFRRRCDVCEIVTAKYHCRYDYGSMQLYDRDAVKIELFENKN